MICKFLKTCWEWNWNLHIFFPLHPKITSSFHLLFFFLFDAKRNLIYDRSISIWVTRELDIFIKKKNQLSKVSFSVSKESHRKHFKLFKNTTLQLHTRVKNSFTHHNSKTTLLHTYTQHLFADTIEY